MNLKAACADLIFDRGDFRGLGDQASAAKRSYSARAALCFSPLPSAVFRRTIPDFPQNEVKALRVPIQLKPNKPLDG
jgi:hypothetical protein